MTLDILVSSFCSLIRILMVENHVEFTLQQQGHLGDLFSFNEMCLPCVGDSTIPLN